MISGPNRYDLQGFFWRQLVSQSPSSATPSRTYEEGWNAINELIRSDGTWNGYQRNTFFANNGDGTFAHVSGIVGLDFSDDSRAFALADLDHDGSQVKGGSVLKGTNAFLIGPGYAGVIYTICRRFAGSRKRPSGDELLNP